jgi:hypothetical protein
MGENAIPIAGESIRRLEEVLTWTRWYADDRIVYAAIGPHGTIATDKPIGMMRSAQVAAEVVKSHNMHLEAEQS